MIDIVLKREEKETVGVLLIPSWNTKTSINKVRL